MTVRSNMDASAWQSERLGLGGSASDAPQRAVSPYLAIDAEGNVSKIADGALVALVGDVEHIS